MKISIIGTVGVPANYGGFETLVENIITNVSSKKLTYTVYCSSKAYTERSDVYKGAVLQYISLDANGYQSILYDIYSLIKATKHSDSILILGVSGCCFLPIYRLFSKKRLIINIDGLEHRREKWGKLTRRFLKFSEQMAIKYGNVIISDNKGIQDYVNNEYGVSSELIAYGGDHVLCSITKEKENEILDKYSLRKEEYSFTVCRIEPENNVHIVLEAFAHSKRNLLIVGNWEKNEYGIHLLHQYKNYTNIKMLSPIYDISILNILRSNCSFYIHGHSAGGTNPSLVEAMFFGKPIIAFDVIYNRETTENKADYFSSVEELERLLSQNRDYYCNSRSMYEIANRKYRWKIIAEQYEALY